MSSGHSSDQPVGHPLPHWTGCDHPGRMAMHGSYANVVPLDKRAHASDLYDAYNKRSPDTIWTYNFIGPFHEKTELEAWIDKASSNADQPYFAILDKTTDKALGIASFMNIRPSHGVIEIGGITLSSPLQRTRTSTEAMFLMMQRAMTELGYRRLEWKCDALNAPSRAAALRFGYQFDGIFEQAAFYKGRNRDTAWYSLLDKDWPPIEQAFKRWLAPDNFDDQGQQITKLADFINARRLQDQPP